MSAKGNAINLLFGDGDCSGFGPASWGQDGIAQTRKAQRCGDCGSHYSVEALSCPHCRAAVAAARERRVMLRIRGDITAKRTMPGHCKQCGERLPKQHGSGRPREVCDESCAASFGREMRQRPFAMGADELRR